MSTTYHISKSGDAVECTARVRRCPLGGQHYSSKAEAMLHAQPTYEISPGGSIVYAGDAALQRERIAANVEYAQFLQRFESENQQTAESVYHSHAGGVVTRAEMIEDIEHFTKNNRGYDDDLIADLRHDLYRADAAALREKKATFRVAYEEYRAKHGPAVRPNFQQLMADAEVKRSEITEKREAAAEATRKKLARVQGAKRLRNAREEVAFSFGKSHSEAKENAFFGEQVPAVAIGAALGEVVAEGRESISEFFAGAGESVRDLFHRG